MRFTKMHGAGNDYVYVNGFEEPFPEDPAELARRMSDRRRGVGGDGLIFILPSDTADARMRMFNADGSESEMCGNGIRCVAKYVYDHGLRRKDRLRIETAAGILTLDLNVQSGRVRTVRVDMGAPIFEAAKIPTTLPGDPVVEQPMDIEGRTLLATCLSMGNPHCVIFVEKATDDLVLGLGPKIETSDLFPARVNVEFVEVVSRREVRQRTWERGSGETWACGTGASAVCAAGVLTGRTERRIVNHLRGGELEIQWREQDDHLCLTGPAEEVFSGQWP